MPTDLVKRIDDAVRVVRERTPVRPHVAILCAPGLETLAERVDDAETVTIDVPGLAATGPGAGDGRLVVGTLGGTPVVVLAGTRARGRPLHENAFPVRVLARWGAPVVTVLGTGGALLPDWEVGDLALVDDHINLMGDNPLVGPNADELGPRFPDMSEPYDPELAALAATGAERLGRGLRRGVYVAVAGPTFGTRAECRMLHELGADMVGTSVVPEVIVARHMNVRVLGLAVMTHRCPSAPPTSLDTTDRLSVAARAVPEVAALLADVAGRVALTAPLPHEHREPRS